MQKRKFSPNPNIALRAVDSKKRKAYRIRKRLSTFLSAREPKYMETGLSVTSLTSTPQVFALSDIAQGDNYTQRNGNLVQSKYLQYEYSCNQVAGTLPINFKMALVLDRQPNGVAPTFAQVFDTSVSQLVFTMKNIAAFQERFKILKEDIGVATSAAGGDAGQSKEGAGQSFLLLAVQIRHAFTKQNIIQQFLHAENNMRIRHEFWHLLLGDLR